MGRPALPIGTGGVIRTTRYARSGAGPGRVFRARARFRDVDGVTRQVERHRPTAGEAERVLREALRDRGRVMAGSVVSLETKVRAVGEAWWETVRAKGRSPGTVQAYRYRLDNSVLPALGGLRLRELTVGVIDRHLQTVARRHGPGTAKLDRTALSGICGYAARHDALSRNLVREAGPIAAGRKPERRTLTLAGAARLRALLAEDSTAVGRDLPDFVGMMLATGMRIGECSALTWNTLDLDAGTVEIRGTAIRILGRGMVIKPTPKTDASHRLLHLPSWCVGMLRRRRSQHASRAAPGALGGDAPVFTAPKGGLRDASNTQEHLTQAFTAAGFGGLTSHGLRRTVATAMDEAGLSARAAADQLGHAHPSLTTDVYFARKTGDTGAAALLEALA